MPRNLEVLGAAVGEIPSSHDCVLWILRRRSSGHPDLRCPHTVPGLGGLLLLLWYALPSFSSLTFLPHLPHTSSSLSLPPPHSLPLSLALLLHSPPPFLALISCPPPFFALISCPPPTLSSYTLLLPSLPSSFVLLPCPPSSLYHIFLALSSPSPCNLSKTPIYVMPYVSRQ